METEVILSDREIKDCYVRAKLECGMTEDEEVPDEYVVLAARCARFLADKMCEKAGLKLVKGE